MHCISLLLFISSFSSLFYNYKIIFTFWINLVKNSDIFLINSFMSQSSCGISKNHEYCKFKYILSVLNKLQYSLSHSEILLFLLFSWVNTSSKVDFRLKYSSYCNLVLLKVKGFQDGVMCELCEDFWNWNSIFLLWK